MYQDDLAKLSKEELIALVLAQAAQIEELTRRIAELEARLGGPPKTPDNSSVPPSQGRKPNRAERRAAKKQKGRPGVFRALAPNPDLIVSSIAEHCPHCAYALTPADQVGFHAYDHIDLPPIRPVITRMHRHRGVCPNCRRGFSAPPPAGMPLGSPFGADLTALILHLHVTQAIGFERLVRLLDEVFGIRISEGAIANMLARAGTPLTAAADTGFAAGFQKLLRRAIAIGQRRPELKDTTLAQYRADLDRKLDRLLAVSPTPKAGQQLARGIRKCRGDLFVFVTRRDVPATNNDCERALRPSVIFRKVTGGFRSQWGARTYADALSVIATGRLHGRSALQALRDALAGCPILVPP